MRVFEDEGEGLAFGTADDDFGQVIFDPVAGFGFGLDTGVGFDFAERDLRDLEIKHGLLAGHVLLDLLAIPQESLATVNDGAGLLEVTRAGLLDKVGRVLHAGVDILDNILSLVKQVAITNINNTEEVVDAFVRRLFFWLFPLGL